MRMMPEVSNKLYKMAVPSLKKKINLKTVKNNTVLSLSKLTN